MKMHKWKTAKLGDVCGVFAGQGAPQGAHNYSANGTPFIKAGDMIDLVQGADEASIQKVTDAVAKSHRLRLFPSGTVLFAKSGMSATKGHIYPLRSPAYVVNHLACLVPNDQQCSSRYLGYFFRKYSPATLIKDSGYPSISLTDISNVFIPLPPLKDQKRIADILDKAAELISLRKQQIEKLDLLVKSKFIDMFGDPVTNPKGWVFRTLREISTRISDGPFGSNLKSEHYTDQGVRILRLQNVGVGCFVDDDKAYVSQEHYETLKKYTCLPGDVIIGTMGNPNLRACLLPAEIGLAINKADCVQSRVNQELMNPCYVCALLNIPETLTLASSMLHGQTRTRISMGQLASFEIPCPPPNLQNEFAEFVEMVETQKAQMQSGLEKLELNYKALMAECFAGESET